MVGLLFGVVINESIHRKFDMMAAVRFHHYYVNLLLLLAYLTMLHNLRLGGVVGDDVISYVSTDIELRRFHSVA